MPQNSPHILQPKHILLKSEETEKMLDKFNISLTQLPKIKITDPALPKGANVSDVIKIERKDEQGTHVYYRVVVL
jgi:DNA-directed RNA polymerase subunit H (RpoH/RPB5)